MATPGLDEIIRQALGTKKCECLSNVTGGIVNAGKAKIYEVDQGNVFVKFNTTIESRPMFDCEVASLLDIASTNTVKVPQPLKMVSGPDSDGTTLICEYLPNLKPIQNEDTWRMLGVQMASLHRHNHDLLTEESSKASSVTDKCSPVKKGIIKFGYHKAHYFGPEFHVPADTWEDTWEFGDRQLSEQWSQLSRKVHKPFTHIHTYPALLHGDLFSINTGQVDGTPVVFDPQSWYGLAEFEGGEDLSPAYQQAYDSVAPALTRGAELRGKIYDLFVNMLLYFCQVDKAVNRETALKNFRELNEDIK